MAKLLVQEGHQVRALPERRGGRVPDLLACGVTVEVKSFVSLAERGGVPPKAEKVANKLQDASGQGAVAFLWGPTSGLTETVARAGVKLFEEVAASRSFKLLREARIVGKGFDLTFNPAPALKPGTPKRQGPERRPPPPALGA